MAEIRLLLTAVQYFTRIRVPAWVGHDSDRTNLRRQRLEQRNSEQRSYRRRALDGTNHRAAPSFLNRCDR